MNKDKYVFAQMTEYLDYPKFRRLVRKYRGDSYVKRFTCWNQLLTLMFGQLSGRESLRDLVTVLEAHQSKCYHLGLGDRPASRNAVSLANQTRDCRIFEEFASFMMEGGAGSARKTSSASAAMSTHLIQRPFHCASRSSPGQGSADTRAGRSPMSSTTWRRMCLPSTTSRRHPPMTRRPCRLFRTRLVRTTCSTGAATLSPSSIGSTGWSRSSS